MCMCNCCVCITGIHSEVPRFPLLLCAHDEDGVAVFCQQHEERRQGDTPICMWGSANFRAARACAKFQMSLLVAPPSLCIYIYIYIHTHVYVYVHTYLFIYIHIYIQTCKFLRVARLRQVSDVFDSCSLPSPYPPKNGEIALWSNTCVAKCKYYVSQKKKWVQ